MAIQFVGYETSVSASQTYATVSLTALTGGIDTEAREGDFVLGVLGYGGPIQFLGWLDSDGGTNLVDRLYYNDTRDTTLDVHYWVMGATPMTQLQYHGTGNNINGQAAIALVFRNVSSVTPIDVTTTTASGGDESHANSPSITPVTAGAWIIAAGACACATSASAKTGPANMGTFYQERDTGNLTYGCVTGAALKTDWTSGAVDPDAWTGGDSSTSDSWAAATIVLRPAIRSTLYYEVALSR